MDGSDTKRYGDQAKETARSPTLRRTRFVCVSDTHNHAVKLPKGDVLIHAGDLTNQGTSSELIKAVQWLEKADFEAKIVVAGNHDITLDADFYKEYGIYFHNQRPESPSECLDLLRSSPSIIYLAHSAIKIRLGSSSGPHTEFSVFGSPCSPRDGLWAFSYPRSVPKPISPPGPDETQKHKTRSGSRSRSKSRGPGSKSASQQRCEQRPVPPALESVRAEQQQSIPDSNPDSTGDVAAATAAQTGSVRHSNRPTEPDLPGPSAEEIWAKIPLSADVVVTHGPPRGHRDEAADRQRSAGCEALRCRLWRVRPRLAVCGHVHEGRGAEVVRWDIEGGLGSANGRFMEVHGAHRPWEDPAPAAGAGAGKLGGGGARISLVDLTGDVRTGRKPLDNDGGVGPSSGPCGAEQQEDGDREWTLVGKPTEAGSGINRVLDDTHSMCHGATPGIGTLGVGGDPEKSARCDREALLGRMGRRETCIVNCAIMANSYPHVGGKKLNKPIVVDLDLPVWED